MYHPTRGGVRGGRDQFNWDDVKVDKHRENYIGHSLKAAVGRWQKGKDLFWYTRDKNAGGSEDDALKEEIRRVKEEEEQAMREALGLAPKRASKSQGNRLDKHEFSELVKRGSTAEDLGAGHADAAKVHGLGFARETRTWETESVGDTSVVSTHEDVKVGALTRESPRREDKESGGKKRKHDDDEKKEKEKKKKHDKKERREKRHSRGDSGDEKRSESHHRKKDKGSSKQRRRHDSDSD